MRTWGRVLAPTTEALVYGGPGTLGGPAVLGGGTSGFVWQVVETDSQGFNDYVYITALIQCLKLSIGESPFWGDWGIPAKRSVVQQIAPDFYVALMQQRFAPYFASLQITRIQGTIQPTYDVALVTNQGVPFQAQIPV